jgi:hypothetical protein
MAAFNLWLIYAAWFKSGQHYLLGSERVKKFSEYFWFIKLATISRPFATG